MKLGTDHVEALVAAVLAVNNYRVERIWTQMPGLRAGRLTDPEWVAKADLGEVVANLTASGHDRGMLAGMMAERLQTLMQAIVAGSLDGLPAALTREDRDGAVKILCSVKGIGPKVADTALMLMK